ncbi:hypothetical protein [Citrobacter sp. R56]|uniref:hypothetical protein n=1 Tax=Citrobacter sp. R56 TaxID=1573676 RepID=UPI00193C5D3D|nr:hypothetical protein [Citrobacter sp. R56]QRG77531.1 hypothetical protein JM656_12915 [Citrobacter sp. R56]
MSRYNTNNPVLSNEVKDFSDNAQIVDEIVHSQQTTTKDRSGNNLKTWRGIQQDANTAIANFGYITMDSFEDGNNLTLPNQVLRYEATGDYYRWDGAFLVGGKVVWRCNRGARIYLLRISIQNLFGCIQLIVAVQIIWLFTLCEQNLHQSCRTFRLITQ